MKIKSLIALAMLGAGAMALAKPAARNWLATATPTPAGTYVYGNPAAKAKLVEYLSYTCNHCAHFSVESSAPLKADYVAKGRASVEIRHALRDRLDFAAALLARCDGPARFLGHSEAIFATQDDWMNKGIAFEGANAQRLQKLTISQALGELARGSGLDALMRKRGMAPQKINACLANESAQTKLAAMADEAWEKRKINGTPAFMINGQIAQQTASWAALKPQLDATLN